MGDLESKPSVPVVINPTISASKENEANPDDNATPSHLSILSKLHAGYFTISLSLGAQALLWKNLSGHKEDSQAPWHTYCVLPSMAFLLLWGLALLTLATLSFLYILRCFFHFNIVKKEFLHHIGVNYMYAPWISWLLMLQSAPKIVPRALYYQVLCWIFSIPILLLDVKLYGQWFTTKKRFLSVVANPISQISVMANLVAAQAIAQLGWKESAVLLFSIAMAHYLVVFVTLYQHPVISNSFPTMLRPAYFLFFATPSMASLAWKSISGTFVTSSKMLFFLSLFLFMSLACRPALFRKSMKKLTVAWWVYSFPLTFLVLASAEYAHEVKGSIAPAFMLVLSILSVLVFIGLILLTASKPRGYCIQY
ncbi:S-type anion channel like [Quillaja saponaria]|uniref:S-type anion channel like n=1 Tax=Quillaja saponaria TaxID=32244 RepID=A0AAD7KWP3_QUISA|nr:S-type anion channel like [Quillaja saponaria]